MNPRTGFRLMLAALVANSLLLASYALESAPGLTYLIPATGVVLSAVMAGVFGYIYPAKPLPKYLDSRAIHYAIEFLQLDGAIQFHFDAMTNYPHFAGYYQYDAGVHNIHVNRELSAAEQSKTIWHELAHCHQCEHDFLGIGELFHEDAYQESINAALDDRPDVYELEATKLELMHYDVPLVVYG